MTTFDPVTSLLHIYDDTWELNEGGCPCDLHLLDFLRDRDIRNATIFHMGTGAHHIVGIKAVEGGTNNAVIGITASPGEHDRYIKLGVENPRAHTNYKAFFGDIYQLDARLLPPLDVVSLFHLCEFRTAKNDTYGALTDLEVARLLWDQLRPGGYMLFYKLSMSYDKAIPNIARLQEERQMVPEPDFKTLQVFRKPDPKPAPGRAPAKRAVAKTKAKARMNTKPRTRAKAKSKAKGKKRK
jgi:hypothetical protein